MIKSVIRAVASRSFRLIKTLTGYAPPERVFRHLHFKGQFKVRLPNGRQVRMNSWGNRVENELAWLGWDGHEPDERRCWVAMLADGGDVLDIGANTASFAILAKGMSPTSRVVAFEPIKRIAEMAGQNVAVSGLEIEVVCAAIGRANGELPIYDPGGDNAYSASLDPDFLPGTKDSYLVPVLSLDQYCANNSLRPTAIKLDVEGFEGEVICGAKSLLQKGECAILCEWLGSSESHDAARNLLVKNGYVALSVETLEVVDLGQDKTFLERNVILLPSQKVEWVRNQVKLV